MSFLKRLFGAKETASSFTAPLRPDESVFIIGDIHGCLGPLQDLQVQMRDENPDAHQVYVGDYIDRGDQTKEVLETLYAERDNPQITCLRGNHEDMLLSFLQNPVEKGPRWLRYGGQNTLGSFGLDGIPTNSDEDLLKETARQLQEVVGMPLLRWLDTLPTSWQSGNLAVVHAGADPHLPIAEQHDRTLKWGHRDFMTVPRTDGIWVAHGHNIVDEANAEAGRIAVDTGAYATGRLTAAYIAYGELRFLQAG